MTGARTSEMTRLDDATVDRLAKILGMLGSAHAGERAAAAAKADAIVRAAGVTWRDIIVPSPQTVPQLEDAASWRRMAIECHALRAQLKPTESDFITSLIGWRGEPSPKQLAWLAAIHDRLHGGAE
jgi:hypothetical protein